MIWCVEKAQRTYGDIKGRSPWLDRYVRQDEDFVLVSSAMARANKVEAPSRRLRSGETPLPPWGYQGRSPWL